MCLSIEQCFSAIIAIPNDLGVSLCLVATIGCQVGALGVDTLEASLGLLFDGFQEHSALRYSMI